MADCKSEATVAALPAAGGGAAGAADGPPACLIIGTGEYVTGYGAASAKTDKSAGVVMLSVLDLRRRGLVGDILMAGTCGTKLPAVRAHVQRAVVEAYPGSGFSLDCVRTFPADGVESDPNAYKAALAELPRGSVCIIFTPDDSHFPIALDCIAGGHHVLVTKPIVKTLAQHAALAEAAEAAGVLVAVEVHKRWDPLFADARDRLRALGAFSFLSAYMSQPKHQLATFASWAGRSSDISYYLNSHLVDYTEWATHGRARPVQVVGAASTGVAEGLLGRPCEDTITLSVQYENLPSGARGVGVFTASWIAPPSDVHSQQRFHAMAAGGEVTIDQAHRGYTAAADGRPFASCNPLFMRYTPSEEGAFAGQHGYGYRSFEAFVQGAAALRAGTVPSPRALDGRLATVHGTFQTTAVLEAGRKSLDAGGRPVLIEYGDPAQPFRPTALRLME